MSRTNCGSFYLACLIVACTGPRSHQVDAADLAPDLSSDGTARPADALNGGDGKAGQTADAEVGGDDVGADSGGAPTAPSCPPPTSGPPPHAAPIFPPADQPENLARCQMPCHQLAGCSVYDTGGPDLCPCLGEMPRRPPLGGDDDGAYDFGRVRDACMAACGSAAGDTLIEIWNASRSCYEAVRAAAEAFDTYSLACGAHLDR